jgi:hypothetical protein
MIPRLTVRMVTDFMRRHSSRIPEDLIYYSRPKYSILAWHRNQLTRPNWKKKPSGLQQPEAAGW